MEQNNTGYSGYVTTINKIRKHSNADRLNVVTVFGNDSIVNSSYYEGQKIVYFPSDGQLSEEFCIDNKLLRVIDENGNNIGGYMDPCKRNIAVIKLRGEKSDGLVLPIEVLSKYTDVSKLNDGDRITVLNGHEICKKYIPVSNSSRNNYKSQNSKKNNKEELKISYPFFVEHIDTAQLVYCENAFKSGDTCYITLKMHGTSGRTMNAIQLTKKKSSKILKNIFHMKDKELITYKAISGTRHTTLREYDGGYYGNNAFRQKYHDLFKDKLPKGMEVFYEIVGWVNENTTIMPKCSNKKIKDKDFVKKYGDETIFSYGCAAGENDCYVYRMTMTNPDGVVIEVPWEQVQIECEKMGVKCVPTFDKFIFTTWEDLMQRVEKYYEGTDPIGRTHIREGVVIRIDNREKFTAFKHKGFEFKYLEGLIKDTADTPDMEEMEEVL